MTKKEKQRAAKLLRAFANRHVAEASGERELMAGSRAAMHEEIAQECRDLAYKLAGNEE